MVLLDTCQGTIFTLNETGREIWLALQSGQTLESIVLGLVRDTGQSQDVVEADVSEFIGALEQGKLLK